MSTTTSRDYRQVAGHRSPIVLDNGDEIGPSGYSQPDAKKTNDSAGAQDIAVVATKGKRPVLAFEQRTGKA